MTEAEKNKPGLMRKLSRTFLAGLVTALPLALTIAIIIWMAELIQRFLGPESAFGKLLGSIGLRFVTSDTAAYLVGVLGSLALIYLLGAFVEAGMKNRWHTLVDGILNRVPLVRTIYNILNKLIRMFEMQDQTELKSMSAVMVNFGGKDGGASVLALLTSPEPIKLHGRDCYAVMIPTAPVPFGGAILYMPVDWVESANIEFDGLLNIYMSMGATSGDYLRK